MSLFSTVTTDEQIQGETDNLGGRQILETDIYPLEVTLAYGIKADSGAQGLVVHFKTDAGAEHRETFWVTSGKAKGNKNYYEKDGKKSYLPGFNMATSLCLLTVGKELAEMPDEEKVVKLYSSDAKAEVPTKVPMLTTLIGKKVLGGMFKKIENKQAKGADGLYADTAETREVNEIDKFFRASDKMTTAEILGQATEPGFYNSWIERWKGKVRDRSKKIDGNVKQVAGFGTAAAANNKPSKSLFAAG